MIIKHSQEDLIFDLPENIRHVGLKISGGADSAIVCYMLSKYIFTERPDLRIVPITIQCIVKSFQIEFSTKVIDFCKKEFSPFIFLNHQIDHTRKYEDYISQQHQLLQKLYDDKVIDVHYLGLTQNPPVDITNNFKNDGPYNERNFTGQLKPTNTLTSYRPLVNINKQGVCELYKHFNLMDTLFPLTRSCENLSAKVTQNYKTHCNSCWFCEERKWGFGRLI